MPPGKLSPLQARVLVALAGLRPPWALSGGAALAGFYTQHRETRDLDLFFHGLSAIADVVRDARSALDAAGMSTETLRTAATFGQLAVRDGEESVVLDLVADPTPIVEPARTASIGDTAIFVETAHQLLVNKLGALLGRSELRDLIDVRALLEHGGELDRALADAATQDAGFSPLTFAWSARNLAVRRIGTAQGLREDELAALEAFREELVAHVIGDDPPAVRLTRPNEIEAVLQLDGPARYRHFIKRVVDEERVWGLKSTGWALMANNDGNTVFPLWPAREYAELYAANRRSGYRAEEISLEELVTELLPRLAKDEVRPGVFPLPSSQGVTLTVDELLNDLHEEGMKYWR